MTQNNLKEIKRKILRETDLSRFPFDEFWFETGFEEGKLFQRKKDVEEFKKKIDDLSNLRDALLIGTYGNVGNKFNKKLDDFKDQVIKFTIKYVQEELKQSLETENKIGDVVTPDTYPNEFIQDYENGDVGGGEWLKDMM